MLNDYEKVLVAGWEDLYKKGQLSLWILLALKAGPKTMSDIKAYISELTKMPIDTDDKSMYRTLRRFTKADMITFTLTPNPNGPSYKVFTLTPTGANVLQAFLERNIIPVFYAEATRTLIHKEQYNEESSTKK